MSTETEAPSWNHDEDQRWLEGQTRALTAGQETAARTAQWWMEAAATLAKLRAEAESNLPPTPDGWEEWFETHKIRTHVDVPDFLAYLDQMVAACDSIAGDYRREGKRLGKEREEADKANGEAAARWAAQNAGKIPG
jgi:hypothetical protein